LLFTYGIVLVIQIYYF